MNLYRGSARNLLLKSAGTIIAALFLEDRNLFMCFSFSNRAQCVASRGYRDIRLCRGAESFQGSQHLRLNLRAVRDITNLIRNAW